MTNWILNNYVHRFPYCKLSDVCKTLNPDKANLTISPPIRYLPNHRRSGWILVDGRALDWYSLDSMWPLLLRTGRDLYILRRRTVAAVRVPFLPSRRPSSNECFGLPFTAAPPLMCCFGILPSWWRWRWTRTAAATTTNNNWSKRLSRGSGALPGPCERPPNPRGPAIKPSLATLPD